MILAIALLFNCSEIIASLPPVVIERSTSYTFPSTNGGPDTGRYLNSQEGTPHYTEISRNFFVDSKLGSDSNDGLDSSRPVKTIRQLLTLEIASFDMIHVARGSYFREILDLSGVPNVTIRDYGTGVKPIFDCADSVLNSSFLPTSGQPGVFQTTFTNQFPDNRSQYSVWENNRRLYRATSISNCKSTPGSFYAPTPAGGSTDIIYVHSSDNSDVTANNKLYEISRRGYGIYLENDCKVYNMHTRRNGANNGSFMSGLNSYLFRVEAEDGIKHNLFMESGVAEECVASKADNPVIYGGATMFVSYSLTGGNGNLDVYYKNCLVLGGMNNDPDYQRGMIGIYAHSGGLPYRSIHVEGGIYKNVDAGIGGESDTIVVENANFYNCATVLAKDGGSVRFEKNIVTQMPTSKAPLLTNVASLFCNNNKFYLPGGTVTIQGNISSIQANNNTVFTEGFNSTFFYSLAGLQSRVEMKNNIFTSDTEKYPGFQVLFQKDNNSVAPAMIVSSNNHGLDLRYRLDYADQNLAAIQGWGAGYEAGSANDIVNSDFTGSKISGDFFLPKSHRLNGSAGSQNTYDQQPRYGVPFFLLTAGDWRWRDDNGSEKGATWKADQNTPVSLSLINDVLRLRIEVLNNWLDKEVSDSLQYSTSSEGPWTNIGDSGSNKMFMIAKMSSNLINVEPTTSQLKSATPYFFQPGFVLLDTASTPTFSMASQSRTEFEWAIKSNYNIKTNTTYYFRQFGTTKIYTSPISYASVNTSALPVFFSSFTLKQENLKVKLEWETTEFNNDYFEIQRSSDGASWITIATLKGQGASTIPRKYSIYDEYPLSDTNYYHIIQHSSDGRSIESDAKLIKMPVRKLLIVAYPNPTSSIISFSIKSQDATNLSAVLSSINGSIIHRETFKYIAANTINKINLLKQPPPGVYILTLSGTGILENLTVVVK